MFTVVSQRPTGTVYGMPPARALPYVPPPRPPLGVRRLVSVRARRCRTLPGAVLCAAGEWCTGGRRIRIYRGWGRGLDSVLGPPRTPRR